MNFIGLLEDRIAIRELLDEYSDAVTRRDGAQWAGVWLDSEACEWMLPSMAEWAQYIGKKQIVEEWHKMMGLFHGAEGSPKAITQTTVPGRIIVNGDSAEVRCYTTEVFMSADNQTLQTKGQYDDVCIKQEGRWYFQKRVWTLFELNDYKSVQTKEGPQ